VETVDGKEVDGDFLTTAITDVYEKENKHKGPWASITLKDLRKGVEAKTGLTDDEVPDTKQIDGKPQRIAFLPGIILSSENQDEGLDPEESHENVEESSQDTEEDTEEPHCLPSKEQKQELAEVLRKNLDAFPKSGRHIECPINSCSKEYDAYSEYIEHALAERKKHGADTVVEMWRNAGVDLEG